MTDYLQETYSSQFYGYINGDILIHSSIVDILQTVRLHPPSKRILIVGRRYNTYITAGIREQFTSQQVVDSFIQNSIRHNEQFIPVAQDYFIFTEGTLTAENVLPVVIGRNLYDNYLCTVCKQDSSCTLMDASQASIPSFT